jgi:uncharacterized protein with HEPN domain
MPASTPELLHDILQEADFLASQLSTLPLEAFLQDEVRKRAFVRSLEIIGEAAKKVPQEMRDRAPLVSSLE